MESCGMNDLVRDTDSLDHMKGNVGKGSGVVSNLSKARQVLNSKYDLKFYTCLFDFILT